MILYGMAVVRMNRAEILAGEHVDDSGLALRFGNIDGDNSGVREWAAQKLGPGHALERDVAGVNRASRHLGHAIPAGNRMIHDGKILRVAPVGVPLA